MDKLTRARNILNGLNTIDQRCDDIANKNIMRAMQSFNTEQDTVQLMELIIDKTYQIQQLQDLRRRALAVIKTAPEKYRTIIELHFIGGKTLAQIAREINRAENTASRLVCESVQWFADKFIS